MDFVRSTGNLMADDSLKETIFGSVDEMLQGKMLPQDVTALRLLMEELLRSAFEKATSPLSGMDELDQVLEA